MLLPQHTHGSGAGAFLAAGTWARDIFAPDQEQC